MEQGTIATALLSALELLWPARCVGCDLPGTLLCKECEASLPLIDQSLACPRCGSPFGSLVCTECAGLASSRPFTAARAAGTFEGALSRMVLLYKDAGERRLAPLLARLMAQAAGEEWRQWADAIVFVPASQEAYARRGFDHMGLVAENLSAMARIPVADVLVRRPAKDQRELGRIERLENAAGTFRVLGGAARFAIHGANVLLVDDVFTTGATLSSATEALLAADAGEVRALVAARVW